MRFPLEILEHILKESSIASTRSYNYKGGQLEQWRLRRLAKFRLVDREWNAVATPLFWHSPYLGSNSWKAVQFLLALKEWPARAATIKTLEISEGLKGHERDDFLLFLLKLCPNVREFWIKSFEVDLSLLLAAAPHLRYLQLDACTLIIHDDNRDETWHKDCQEPAQQHPLQILVMTDTVWADENGTAIYHQMPMPFLKCSLACLRCEDSSSNHLNLEAIQRSLPHIKYLDWDKCVELAGLDSGTSLLNACAAITHLQAPVSSCIESQEPDDEVEYLLVHLRNCRIKTLHLLHLGTIEELVTILDQNDPALSELSTILYSPAASVREIYEEDAAAEVETGDYWLEDEVAAECARRGIKFGGICGGGLEEFGELLFPESRFIWSRSDELEKVEMDSDSDSD